MSIYPTAQKKYNPPLSLYPHFQYTPQCRYMHAHIVSPIICSRPTTKYYIIGNNSLSFCIGISTMGGYNLFFYWGSYIDNGQWRVGGITDRYRKILLFILHSPTLSIVGVYRLCGCITDKCYRCVTKNKSRKFFTIKIMFLCL